MEAKVTYNDKYYYVFGYKWRTNEYLSSRNLVRMLHNRGIINQETKDKLIKLRDSDFNNGSNEERLFIELVYKLLKANNL